jgi:ankyrin repeat protein
VNSGTDLVGGHYRLIVWVTGCLTVVAMAVGGCGKGAGKLASKQTVEGPDKRLLQAAQEGNLGLLKAAIAEGARVNCRGTNDLTPLLQVLGGATGPLDASRRECIATLLEGGAAVDGKDDDGRTALIYATRVGDLETVRLLVEAGSYVKSPDRFHRTALLYAAEGHHRDIVAYLAANGDLQTPPYSAKKAKKD